MLESLFKRSLEPYSVIRSRLGCIGHHFPSLSAQFVHFCEIRRAMFVLPFLHKAILWREVYEFSKVEKKIVANQQNSCKGSQCNRVYPITNPLNSGVTL